jgi:hypothetical protein
MTDPIDARIAAEAENGLQINARLAAAVLENIGAKLTHTLASGILTAQQLVLNAEIQAAYDRGLADGRAAS